MRSVCFRCGRVLSVKGGDIIETRAGGLTRVCDSCQAADQP